MRDIAALTKVGTLKLNKLCKKLLFTSSTSREYRFLIDRLSEAFLEY